MMLLRHTQNSSERLVLGVVVLLPSLLLSQHDVCVLLQGAGMTVNGTTLPHSFLAKGSPQQILKAETKAVSNLRCVCVCLHGCLHTVCVHTFLPPKKRF